LIVARRSLSGLRFSLARSFITRAILAPSGRFGVRRMASVGWVYENG
jgi:hypothetical protein